MALKNLFDMVKADRYTTDGREAIIKAQEAETEDKVYQIGEISQKTGLQKTANGWVKPKRGNQPGAKKEEPKNVHGVEVDKIYERQLKRIKELKAKGFTDEQIDNDKIIKQTKEDMKNVGKKPEAKNAETNYGKVEKKDGKWGVQQKLGKGSQFIEHKDKKDATEALKNYTEGYNTTARSKQDPHSDEARQVKQWNKETEKIKKENRAERRAEHAAQFQNQPTLSQTDGKGNKVEIKITESKGGGFYVDKYVNGKKVGINNANTRESAEAKAKSMMEQHMADPDYRAESKPAAQKVKLGENADKYVFRDLDSLSDEDKVFRALVSELDGTFGDRDGNPDNVESWANDWQYHAQKEGGIGFEKKWGSEEPDAVVSGDKVKEIIRNNPDRWNRIIKNAKQFYSGNGHSGDFESDVYYPEDSAPRILTGDTRIRVRKA